MIRRAQPWLGTMVEISIAGETDLSRPGVAAAMDAAFAAVASVHRHMSFHEAGSDVAAINRLAVGATCAVDARTAAVLRCARLLEEASDGRFNIGCADVLAGWGYLPAPAAPVAATTPGLLRAAVLVGAGNLVTRLQPAGIDLGGIAKGYAVDCAIDALRAAGIRAACVNAGGDMRAYGDIDFPVTVRDPAMPTRPGLRLQLRNQALATSATYFSMRTHGGKSYSALVDCTDGSPVVHGRSATVQARTCMLADGLTKVVMASGDATHPALARFSATAVLI